jgi:hypothetical protein
MADKRVEIAKEETRKFLAENNIQPQAMMRFGEMADATIKDKALYPMFREQLIKTGMADETDIPTKYNYTILVIISTMGRLAGQLTQAKIGV